MPAKKRLVMGGRQQNVNIKTWEFGAKLTGHMTLDKVFRFDEFCAHSLSAMH